MIAWNFQKIVGTCQFRVPWFGYPCCYSSLTLIEQKKIIQALDKNRKINKSNRPSHCIQKTDITEDNEIAQNKTSIFQTG